MGKKKRSFDWQKFLYWFVLVSLVLAIEYIVVILFIAPAHTTVDFERTKGDYVLMLLQCSLGIAAVALPSILQKRLNFVIPSKMMIFYTLFLYGSTFLGEVLSFYYKVPHWDTILHTFSGAMLGALGFSVITFLNKTDGIPISLSPAFVAVFTFCFAMALGVVWEIYEFAVDYFFNTNMQKFAIEGGELLFGQFALMDTMKDLIVDMVGALVMSVFGYISLKRKNGLVEKLTFKKIPAEEK